MLSEGKKTRLIRLGLPLLSHCLMWLTRSSQVWPGLFCHLVSIYLGPLSFSSPPTPYPLPSINQRKDSFQTHFISNLPLEYVLPTWYRHIIIFWVSVFAFPQVCSVEHQVRETLSDVVCALTWVCMSVCSLALSQSSIRGCVNKALSRVMAQRWLWLL